MNTTSGRRALLPILAIGVPLAFLLFIAHLLLLAVVSPVPTADWFLVPKHVGVTQVVAALSLKPFFFVALPVAFMAFGLARAFRKHVSVRSGWSSVSLVFVWFTVYTLCWLALFALLAGPNPSQWSAAVVSQSGSLHVLVLAAAGLFVGLRPLSNPSVKRTPDGAAYLKRLSARMHQLRHLRSVSLLASLLALASVCLLVVKTLFLNERPALFHGAYELGTLVDAVLASVVASYVFYVLVVHLPTERNRDRVRPHIRKHSVQVVANCRLQLAAFTNATGQVLDFDKFAPANLITAFSMLNPNAPAPMSVFPGGATATWLYYLEHFIKKTDANIRRTLANAQFVEAELVELLTSVEDCDYFAHMRLMGSAMPIRNANMSVWAPPFIEYCSRCLSLHRYLSRALP